MRGNNLGEMQSDSRLNETGEIQSDGIIFKGFVVQYAVCDCPGFVNSQLITSVYP